MSHPVSRKNHIHAQCHIHTPCAHLAEREELRGGRWLHEVLRPLLQRAFVRSISTGFDCSGLMAGLGFRRSTARDGTEHILEEARHPPHHRLLGSLGEAGSWVHGRNRLRGAHTFHGSGNMEGSIFGAWNPRTVFRSCIITSCYADDIILSQASSVANI